MWFAPGWGVPREWGDGEDEGDGDGDPCCDEHGTGWGWGAGKGSGIWTGSGHGAGYTDAAYFQSVREDVLIYLTGRRLA